jgi:hypothetical protein
MGSSRQWYLAEYILHLSKTRHHYIEMKKKTRRERSSLKSKRKEEGLRFFF